MVVGVRIEVALIVVVVVVVESVWVEDKDLAQTENVIIITVVI